MGHQKVKIDEGSCQRVISWSWEVSAMIIKLYLDLSVAGGGQQKEGLLEQLCNSGVTNAGIE